MARETHLEWENAMLADHWQNGIDVTTHRRLRGARCWRVRAERAMAYGWDRRIPVAIGSPGEVDGIECGCRGQ